MRKTGSCHPLSGSLPRSSDTATHTSHGCVAIPALREAAGSVMTEEGGMGYNLPQRGDKA
jgi:hypothetical protein